MTLKILKSLWGFIISTKAEEITKRLLRGKNAGPPGKQNE
jgi:hypothetical protein